MAIKQLTVFVENKQGSLVTITDTLAANNVNIRALSIAETEDFGILRGLTEIQGGVQAGELQLQIPQLPQRGGDGVLVEGAAPVGEGGELEEVVDLNAGEFHIEGDFQQSFPAHVAPAAGGKGEVHTDSSS